MKMWNGLIGACVILCVATLAASAEDKGGSHGNPALTNAPITVTGTLQAEGYGLSLTATDGTLYTIRSSAALSEKVGQSVTLTGIVREKDGKKMLMVRKSGKEKDANKASATLPSPAK